MVSAGARFPQSWTRSRPGRGRRRGAQPARLASPTAAVAPVTAAIRCVGPPVGCNRVGAGYKRRRTGSGRPFIVAGRGPPWQRHKGGPCREQTTRGPGRTDRPPGRFDRAQLERRRREGAEARLQSSAGDPSFDGSSKLRRALTVDGITARLERLQQIADENDGTRAAGFPGFDASADYVAATMDRAGWRVEPAAVRLRRLLPGCAERPSSRFARCRDLRRGHRLLDDGVLGQRRRQRRAGRRRPDAAAERRAELDQRL